ncbi:hypothetical protein OCH7691_03932 [Oceanibacterium hippocampi]|uniref:Uncharacterized protein n=2 Tax=Oceanibacterium hippocampi TaxID=745714 RepID=A0A1Y5TWW7_9PROT|nr:hypothetical protein OCH7691_03932 [Oceanibacterium hippocampi]
MVIYPICHHATPRSVAARYFLTVSLAFLFLAGIAGPGPALAAEPAALVVDLQGSVSPEVEPFSELAEGDRLTLADDGEIIIMHYAACVESHYRGGEVTIGALGIETTGESVSETSVECPRKVMLAEGANKVASVVLRGGESVTVVNARPVFIFLAEGIERIEIRREGLAVGTLEVANRFARWPEGTAPLSVGAGYEIAFIGGKATQTAAASVAGDAGVTIVQPQD